MARTKTPKRLVEIQCALDIEYSPESLHVHAVPEGIEIRPGDVVIMRDAPTEIVSGHRQLGTCHATVVRANWAERLWTRIIGMFELTELYEVGFAPKETP